jgi:hypothetical protein
MSLLSYKPLPPGLKRDDEKFIKPLMVACSAIGHTVSMKETCAGGG